MAFPGHFFPQSGLLSQTTFPALQMEKGENASDFLLT